MHIGIIFYSFSRHTLKVAKKLKEQLISYGYEAGLEQLEPAEPFHLTAPVAELKSIPAISQYDALILASPVHGGRMAGPMAGFLENIPSLNNKPVFCLATHFLPYSMGGRQMIDLMKDACESNGAKIMGFGNVPRLSFRRNIYITKIVDTLKNQLPAKSV